MATRRDLATKYAEINGITITEADSRLLLLTEVLHETLAEEGEAKLTGFGSFKVVEGRRTVTNPQTGEPINARFPLRVRFKPSSDLKLAINRQCEDSK